MKLEEFTDIEQGVLDEMLQIVHEYMCFSNMKEFKKLAKSIYKDYKDIGQPVPRELLKVLNGYPFWLICVPLKNDDEFSIGKIVGPRMQNKVKNLFGHTGMETMVINESNTNDKFFITVFDKDEIENTKKDFITRKVNGGQIYLMRSDESIGYPVPYMYQMDMSFMEKNRYKKELDTVLKNGYKTRRELLKANKVGIYR